MAKNSSSDDRRSAARERARQVAEAQAKREKTVKTILYTGIGVVVVAVIAVVGSLVWNASRPVAPPQNVASGSMAFASSGGELMAVAPDADPEEIEESGLPPVEESDTDEGAPRIKVYLDFQCPGCQTFEVTNSSTLIDLAEEGSIVLEYEPVAMLNEYSTRSANMTTCIADSGQSELLPGLFATMFENQPDQGGAGLEDSELLAMAEGAGVDIDAPVSAEEAETVADCTTGQAFEGYLSAETQTALGDEGIESTPAILIDGELYEGDWSDAEQFATDVLRAAGQIGG